MTPAVGIKIACALCHLIEFHDTGEPLDKQAFDSLLNDPEVRDWIESNLVMLPVRRDGKDQLP